MRPKYLVIKEKCYVLFVISLFTAKKQGECPLSVLSCWWSLEYAYCIPSLLRGKTPATLKVSWCDRKLHLMVRLGKYEVDFHCYYSLIHSDPE